jgi:hypothetical protein
MPQLDHYIFGECQANLINFEKTLVNEFGEFYSLAESVLFVLQYSRFRTAEQVDALKAVQSKYFKDVKSYIDDFRANLSAEFISDPKFSFRVFLIQKPANHASSAEVAMEFVKFDSGNPEEMDRYKHLVTLIKEKHVQAEKKVIVSGSEGAKANTVYVDRGTSDGPVAGLTKDPSRAQGILLLEKLSNGIFENASAIIDSATMLEKRFGELSLPDRAWASIYAQRQSVDVTENKTMALTKGSYNEYMPFYFWLTKLRPKLVSEFLRQCLRKPSYPKIRALFRLFVAADNVEWINIVMKMLEEYADYHSRPIWCSNFEHLLQLREQRGGLYAAVEGTADSILLGKYSIHELISDHELSEQVLTDACMGFANGEHSDKRLLRQIDVIAYARRVDRSIGP